jgi:hypothetical protein
MGSISFSVLSECLTLGRGTLRGRVNFVSDGGSCFDRTIFRDIFLG